MSDVKASENIHDPFTLSLGAQVKFLETSASSWMASLVMGYFKTHVAWLFGTPVVGPVASWVIGFIVSKIFGVLAQDAEFQAYFVNTRRRADKQAQQFDDLVRARSRAETPEELNRAEDAALKSFDNLVKYSS